MSRRDSRASLNVRQNDALTEFENFKKKFLLANKHITKLNSTLSVRIEELQAEISTLYVENLRLRTSEIALAAQLKKEQEKSRKILADAEAATSTLSKHLGSLRHSFNIPPSELSPTLEPKPPLKARRPMSDPNTSPQMPRLSRAPNIPGIYEDDEDDEVASSPLADVSDVSSLAYRKARDKPSSSRFPLPPWVASPPALSTPLHTDVERDSSTKRKLSRKQSGLSSVNTVVDASTDSEWLEGPIHQKVAGLGLGVPERRKQPPLSSVNSVIDASTDSEWPKGPIHPRAASPAPGSPERRSAGLAEDDEERRADELITSELPLTEGLDLVARARKERKERKLKQVERDVVHEDADFDTVRIREKKRRKEEEGAGLKDVTNSPRSRMTLPPLDTHTSDRDRQRTPETEAPTSAATSVTTSRTLSTPATTPITTPQVSQVPTPRTSSPVLPAATSASESEAPPGGRERRVRKSVNYTEPKLNTKMRKPDPVPPAPVTMTAPKKRISSTSALSNDLDGRSSLDEPSRRPVSPLQPPAPKPSTATASSSSSSSGSSVRRKKSRPFIPIDDDEESDGAQADGEYVNGAASGWINTDSRRRSTQGGTARGSSSLRRVLEADDARRHSLAV